MKYFFKNLKNYVDFFLRQKLIFSRKKYFVENESKEGLLQGKEETEREKILSEKFHLNYLKSNSTRRNYLENLYTLDVLDKYLPIDFQENLKVLDIGCKNWFYVQGEYFFFKKFCNDLTLKGIEIDANRLYTNLYSRKEVAKFYIRDLKSTEYIVGNLLEQEDKYDYIVWILPFVFEEPLLKWGLPLSIFQPEKLLKKAYEILKPGGKMVIINQGVNEYNKQKSLCDTLNTNYEEIGEIRSPFLQYESNRYLILIKK